MNKLYRSRSDSTVAGVCGGLGRYLGIDSTWVRLVFVFLSFYNLLGVWVYLVLALIMPMADGGEEMTTPVPFRDNQEATRLIGGGLVLLGTLALLSNVRMPWIAWFSIHEMWPVLMIFVGVLLLMRVILVEE